MDLSLCLKLKFQTPISLQSCFQQLFDLTEFISKVHHIGLQRYRGLKIRLCGKINSFSIISAFQCYFTFTQFVSSIIKKIIFRRFTSLDLTKIEFWKFIKHFFLTCNIFEGLFFMNFLFYQFDITALIQWFC